MIFMTEAVLAFGTNLGNRRWNLEKAIDSVKKLPKTEFLAVSKFYETEPFEVPDEQSFYLNCCAKLETDLEPNTLLGACLGIEACTGRIRTFKNASRIIDIDLIFYGDLKIESSDLVLPHPQVFKREFVLLPLLDLYPGGEAFGIDLNKHLHLLQNQ